MEKISGAQARALYKEAGIGQSLATGIGKGLSYLSRSPRAGSAAMGGLLGGGVGLLTGGDLKSTMLGMGIGAGGGLAAKRYLNFDPREMWKMMHTRGLNTRDWWRKAQEAARAAAK